MNFISSPDDDDEGDGVQFFRTFGIDTKGLVIHPFTVTTITTRLNQFISHGVAYT